jgi:ribosomal subunit interface protein
MQTDVQITFRDMEPSDAIAARIRERVSKLEEFHGRITSCRVVVEAARRRHKATAYQVHIDLVLPGSELAVSRAHLDRRPDDDMNVAIRNAFDAMEKRLKEAAQRRRRKEKARASGPAPE